jgi:hypothetical protein
MRAMYTKMKKITLKALSGKEVGAKLWRFVHSLRKHQD